MDGVSHFCWKGVLVSMLFVVLLNTKLEEISANKYVNLMSVIIIH